MPPSTIITAGSGAILVPSALSYPQIADPTTYLPYSSPQIITSSGTWKHPKPGFSISISYIVLGGGAGGGRGDRRGGAGGGGSGRISTYTTATVTKDLAVTIGAGGAASSVIGTAGTDGGITTFNSLSADGGIAGGVSSGTSTGCPGGAGGFGGGGGSGEDTGVGGAGGEGLDFTGGGGGVGGASGLGGVAGKSDSYGQMAVQGSNGSTYLTAFGSGWPNGQTIPASSSTFGNNNGGLGGFPGLLFPWMLSFGAGGRSYDFTGTVASSVAGKGGAVFIWYNRS